MVERSCERYRDRYPDSPVLIFICYIFILRSHIFVPIPKMSTLVPVCACVPVRACIACDRFCTCEPECLRRCVYFVRVFERDCARVLCAHIREFACVFSRPCVCVYVRVRVSLRVCGWSRVCACVRVRACVTLDLKHNKGWPAWL